MNFHRVQTFLCDRAVLCSRSHRNTPACGNRPQTAGAKSWHLAKITSAPFEGHVLVSVNPAAQLVFAGRRQARQIAHLLPAEHRRSQRQTVNLQDTMKQKTTFVAL